MAFPGETVGSGAPGPNEDDSVIGPQVMKSAAGYYIGYSCKENWAEPGEEPQIFEVPYSRESGYFATREEAEAVLPTFVEPGESPYERSTEFRGR